MQETILIVIFLIKDIFLELGECVSLLGMLKNQINPYKLGPAAAVDSICQRNTFIKHLSRRSEPQRLPGTSVQLPCVGEIADGANALIYLAEGDKVNAALSEAAMVPGAGVAATGVKYGKKAAAAATEASEKNGTGSKRKSRRESCQGKKCEEQRQKITQRQRARERTSPFRCISRKICRKQDQ